MKKTTKIASIVLALAIAIALVVPFVLGATNSAIPADTTNDYIVDDGGETAEPETTTGETHTCTIIDAYESGHEVDCECGEEFYFGHYRLNPSCFNQFFHKTECECGYSVTEEHNFVEEYDSENHWSRCIDCNYVFREEHNFVDAFYSELHEIRCDCGYTAAMHHGVEYNPASETACYAYCATCDKDAIIPHEWDGFECTHCEFALTGPTGAVVKSIIEREDYYRVRFDVNGENHYVNLDEITFIKGDYVVIEHYGNVINEVKLFVEQDIIYADEENAEDYIHLVSITPKKVIDIIEHDNGVDLVLYRGEYGDTHYVSISNETIIYNFHSGRIVDTNWIWVGDTIITTIVGDKHIVLAY